MFNIKIVLINDIFSVMLSHFQKNSNLHQFIENKPSIAIGCAGLFKVWLSGHH